MSSDTQQSAPAAPEEQPVFDVSDLSWSDSKQLTIIGARMQTGQIGIDALEQHLRDMESVLSKVVVSVPRAWLVRKAPAEIDWSDPAAYGWLKAPRMMGLLKALAGAQTAEALSGNSPTL